MDFHYGQVERHPGRVLLREQLTRRIAELGGTGQTADVMVQQAKVDGPLSHPVWRTEANGGLAYCIEGALRLECVTSAGTNRTVALLGPEEFVPKPASTHRLGYRLRMAPHKWATVATWSPAALREILLAVPKTGMPRFLARTQLGWTPHRERWAILSMLEAPDRIVVVLYDLVARFGIPHGDGVQIALPLIDQQIADLIGTKRERVNRCLGPLIRKGLVRRLASHHLWVSCIFIAEMRDTAPRSPSTSAPDSVLAGQVLE